MCITPTNIWMDCSHTNFAEGSGSNNNKTTYKNYSENQTRAKVAKNVSLHGKKISHTTLAKAEKVYDVAQQEPATFGQIWTDLNSEKISPNGAYKKIQTHQNKIVESQSLAASKQKSERKRKFLFQLFLCLSELYGRIGRFSCIWNASRLPQILRIIVLWV